MIKNLDFNMKKTGGKYYKIFGITTMLMFTLSVIQENATKRHLILNVAILSQILTEANVRQEGIRTKRYIHKLQNNINFQFLP